MLDSFAGALRALREMNGHSLEDLAKLTAYSKPYLGRLESGERPPTEEIATVCDKALGSAPFLLVMYYVEKGDPMHRRNLLNGVAAIAGGAVLASMDGTTAMAAMVDASLRRGLDDSPDWDTLAADFTKRHTFGVGPEFGPEIAAQIMIAQSLAEQQDTEATRGAALLALVYGLWVADTGRLPTAAGLYATAAKYADRSRDKTLQALVRARVASRGPYEGWDRQRTELTARHALNLASKGPAAVEAYSALVHLAALTGDIDRGRKAVRAMYEVADDEQTNLRAMQFDNYLECRAGSINDAHLARERTEALTALPRWQAEANIYLGRAMVAHGDVEAGAWLALLAIQRTPEPSRILAMGVRDVVDAAGDAKSATLTELRKYAATGPTPWEALA